MWVGFTLLVFRFHTYTHTKRYLPEMQAELTHNKGAIVRVFLSKTLGRSKLASRLKCPQEEVGNFGG